MTDTELMDFVKRTLFSVAPDLEGETVDPDRTFHDQFEIDSMDFLNFVIGLNKQTGLEIPEAEYPKLQTASGVVDYLRTHWPGASSQGV
jgi:acyl carrier protein